MSEPKAESKPVMEYATPESLQPRTRAKKLIVDGSTLIGELPMSLPRRCVICNGEEAKRIRKLFKWHDGRARAAPEVVLGVVASFAHERRGTVFYSLCGNHLRERRRLKFVAFSIWFGILLVEVAAIVLVAADRMASEYLILILFGIFVQVSCVKFARKELSLFVPWHIDDHQMALNGAGEPFLESIRTSTPQPSAAP